MDSEITIPDIKALPIYHVDNNVPIPQNTVDAVIKKFFGTSLVYETNKPVSDEEYEFSGKGADANGYERNIWVANCDKESGTKILVYGEKSMGYVSDTAEMHANDGTISKDEAIQQAEALLEEFGITNMQITCAEFAGRYDRVTQTNPSEYGYNISFARVADDVVCHAQNYIPKSTQSAESYSAAIENEIVTVGITKSGIWTFEWKGYFEPA